MVSAADPDVGDWVASTTLVTQPSAGYVSVSGLQFTYTPPGGWYGTTSFIYYVTDSKGATSNWATVYVTVNHVNHPPTGANVSFSTNEDVTGAVAAPSSDPDGDSYSLQITSQSAQGTAWSSGNTLYFSPVANWSGTTSFTYQVVDSSGWGSPIYTASVSVNPINDVPIAQAVSLATNEDTNGNVSLSATDIDSPVPTTFQIVSAPNASYGSAAISGSTLTFTPVANWNGSTTMTYRAQDSAGAWSAPATVTITVNAVNDAPVAVAKTLTTNEDTIGNVSLSATDIDSPVPTAFQIVSAPNASYGSASISGSTLSFAPVADWNGTTTMTYRAQDSAGAWSAPVTVTIVVNPVNDVPIATAPIYTVTTNEDTTTTFNAIAIDVDGDTLQIEMVTTPPASNGSFATSGMSITFTPAANWHGDTAVSYRVYDPAGARSNTVTQQVKVVSVNDTPASTSASVSTNESTSSSPFTPNVVDVDTEDANQHVFQVVAAPAHGVVVLSSDNRSLTFIPTTGYVGADQFTYKATDLAGASVTGIATVNVLQFNFAPTATHVELIGNEYTTIGPVKPVVDDLNTWDQHRFEIIDQPDNVQISVSTDGIVAKPATGFVGEVSFNYRAIDLNGEVVEGVGHVVVLKKNYAPTDITPHSIRYIEGAGGSAVLGVDDVNAWDSHTFSVAQQPVHGTVTIEGNQLFYKSSGSGDVFVRVRVTDSEGMSFEKELSLVSVSVEDALGGGPKQLVGINPKIPSVKSALRNVNGETAVYLAGAQYDQLLQDLSGGAVVVVDSLSSQGLLIEGVEVPPGQPVFLQPNQIIEDGAFALELGASQQNRSGTATIYIAGTASGATWYEVRINLWAFKGDFDSATNPMAQVIADGSIHLSASGAEHCAISSDVVAVSTKNIFTVPTCYVQWSQKYPTAVEREQDGALFMEGPSPDAGEYDIEARAFVVDGSGAQHDLGSTSMVQTVLPIDQVLDVQPDGSIDGYMAYVQSIELRLKQTKGPRCPLTMSEARAIQSSKANSLSMPNCLVEWVELPPGLTQWKLSDAPYLVGTVNSEGTNTLSWKFSAFDRDGGKHSSEVRSYQFTTQAPPGLTFAMDPSALLSGNRYAADSAGGYVGDLRIKGYNAAVRVQKSEAGSIASDEVIPRSYSTELNLRRRVNTEASDVLWAIKTLKYSAEYVNAPHSRNEFEMQLVTVPTKTIVPVFVDTPESVLSSDGLNVTVQIQDTTRPTVAYSEDSMGKWTVHLAKVSGANQYTSVTDDVEVDALGRVTFALDTASMAGTYSRFVAVARLESPLNDFESTRYSPRQLTLMVLNGEALEGSAVSSRISGPAPFTTQIVADLVKPEWTRDIGEVKWETSKDSGVTWESTNDSSTRSTSRLNVRFAQSGIYLVRGTIVNKHSGATAEIAPIEINVFDVPSARVQGPANVFINGTGKYRLVDRAGVPIDGSNMVIEWSTDRGETWAAAGAEYNLTSSEVASIPLIARMRYEKAPADNPMAYKNVKTRVAFKEVRPPRIMLTGPTRPEVGAPSVYNAALRMPYPDMEGTMGGEFVLPDGTVSGGKSVSFVATQEQLASGLAEIQYRGWIDGFRDAGAEGVANLRLRPWEYVWPIFSLDLRVSTKFAPATIQLAVKADHDTSRLEGLKFKWLPVDGPPVTIENSVSESRRTIQVTQAGVYKFVVEATDDRGNKSIVENSVEIVPAPPYAIELAYTPSNSHMRNPLNVVMRPSVSGGHPRDAVEVYRYYVGGELVSESTSRYGNLRLENPGTYAVALEIGTRMGVTETQRMDITVVENQIPTCRLSASEGSTSWMLTANCEDPDGRMISYRWEVDGQQIAITSKTATLSKSTYPNRPSVFVTGIDDSGGQSQPSQW